MEFIFGLQIDSHLVFLTAWADDIRKYHSLDDLSDTFSFLMVLGGRQVQNEGLISGESPPPGSGVATFSLALVHEARERALWCLFL